MSNNVRFVVTQPGPRVEPVELYPGAHVSHKRWGFALITILGGRSSIFGSVLSVFKKHSL